MAARGQTVLVVDDEPAIVQVVAAILASEGLAVLAAHQGTDALETARRERPDLVLTDAMMPGLDGRELCRRIKADPDLAATPVVLMSAVPSLDLRDCGADAFLAKPFDLETLTHAVRRLLAPAV